MSLIYAGALTLVLSLTLTWLYVRYRAVTRELRASELVISEQRRHIEKLLSQRREAAADVLRILEEL